MQAKQIQDKQLQDKQLQDKLLQNKLPQPALPYIKGKDFIDSPYVLTVSNYLGGSSPLRAQNFLNAEDVSLQELSTFQQAFAKNLLHNPPSGD